MAALLLGSLVQTGAAEAGAKIPSTVPYFGLYLNESFDLNLEPDNFYANADNPDSTKILRCSSVDDELCTNSTSVMVIHNLPTCVIDSSFDCIKSVWAIDPSGKKIEGQFLNSLPVKGTTDRPAIPSMLLSATNGFGGLWKIPGVVNSGGTENYFVSTRISSWNAKAAGQKLSTTQYYYGQFNSGIIPVKPVTGNYAPVNSRTSWGRDVVTPNTPPIYTPQNEHFGIVPLECAAAKRPVIACNSRWPLESVVQGKTGVLCDPTPDAFATAMASFVKTSDLAIKMGIEGRFHVERSFSRDNFSLVLENILFTVKESLWANRRFLCLERFHLLAVLCSIFIAFPLCLLMLILAPIIMSRR